MSIEKKLIEDKDMPIKSYNYSYTKDQLWNKYEQKVSLPTVIDRAKKNGFYFPRRKGKTHDREVLTNYAGELTMIPPTINGHPMQMKNGI